MKSEEVRRAQANPDAAYAVIPVRVSPRMAAELREEAERSNSTASAIGRQLFEADLKRRNARRARADSREVTAKR